MRIKHLVRSFVFSLAGAPCILMPGLAGADTQITGIQIYSMGLYSGASGAQGAYVRFSPARPGTEGCSYAPGDQLWIDFSSTVPPDGKALFETALKAYLAGYVVTFGVRGCGDNGQAPLVYRVDVSLFR